MSDKAPSDASQQQNFKDLIIINFIKKNLDKSINIDFQKNFFIDFTFNKKKCFDNKIPSPDSYDGYIKTPYINLHIENNNNINNCYNNNNYASDGNIKNFNFESYIEKNAEIFNCFINSNKAELNLSHFTSENISNLFSDFIQENFSDKKASGVVTTGNGDTNGSYQFPIIILERLNVLLSSEYKKNNSSIFSDEQIQGKSCSKKRVSNICSSILNSSHHNHFSSSNINFLSNTKNVSSITNNLTFINNKRPAYLGAKESESLEMLASFVLLNRNEKQNIFENYIFNINAIFDFNRDSNFIYVEYNLIQDKNFTLSQKIKYDLNFHCYELGLVQSKIFKSFNAVDPARCGVSAARASSTNFLNNPLEENIQQQSNFRSKSSIPQSLITNKDHRYRNKNAIINNTANGKFNSL